VAVGQDGRVARQPRRTDGYAPIGDYAAIGDARSAALVALDGSIDWLCQPRFDSPSVFAALLDAHSGGRFALSPEVPFEAERRYLPETNVLETTYTTAQGTVRVTDAMNMHVSGPLPWTELARRVEGLSGSVPMRWIAEPRFGWGRDGGRTGWRRDVPVLSCEGLELAVHSWDAGEPVEGAGSFEGRFEAREGRRALLALTIFSNEPLFMPLREAVESRLEDTIAGWRRWAQRCRYEGPYRDAVARSALALQLLVYRPTGAIVAAPTTSLPEAIGGSRNWDYRFSWLRDTAFTLEAMLRLGYDNQVHASLAWLLESARRTHPRLQVFYLLDGDTSDKVTELDLEGYRGSRPVNSGNGAADQFQLGNYGDLMQTAWLYVEEGGNALDPAGGRQLAEVADFVAEVWRRPDASIWELGDRRDYVQGKLSGWLALDRAAQLADRGQVPAEHAAAWRREAALAREFIERECWSDERSSYLRAADGEDLDASILLAARVGYLEADDPRLVGTVDTIRAELGDGPLLYRFSGAQEQEGAFLACSFWLVDALARGGRRDEAAELMEQLLALSNDVGLFSEEIDPASGELLGNFPQALSHLALVNAAVMLGDE
jgi:GH15 family glucan-1,4-alpha-glucosidase